MLAVMISTTAIVCGVVLLKPTSASAGCNTRNNIKAPI